MNRRDFLRVLGLGALGLVLRPPRIARAGGCRPAHFGEHKYRHGIRFDGSPWPASAEQAAHPWPNRRSYRAWMAGRESDARRYGEAHVRRYRLATEHLTDCESRPKGPANPNLWSI